MIRRVLMVCVALTLVLSFSVVQAGEKKIVIRLASSFEPGHTTCLAGDEFKKMVEGRSNGAIEVQTFWGGSMGSEAELCESVSMAGIEMMVGGGIPIKMYAPKYQFMNDPFVMKDWHHWKRVWDGGIGMKLQAEVLKKGHTRYVDVMFLGIRHFTSNNPIVTPKDVKGLKLRLPNLPTWVKIWKQMGALPVPIALPELFSSLQLGVADASEGMMSQIFSFHLDEVQKCLSLTGHSIQTGAFTINEAFFSKLSKEHQALIMQAGKEAAAWATKQVIEGDNILLAKLKEKGMQIVVSDQKAFLEMAKPAVEELFNSTYPVTTWKEVLSY